MRIPKLAAIFAARSDVYRARAPLRVKHLHVSPENLLRTDGAVPDNFAFDERLSILPHVRDLAV